MLGSPARRASTRTFHNLSLWVRRKYLFVLNKIRSNLDARREFDGANNTLLSTDSLKLFCRAMRQRTSFGTYVFHQTKCPGRGRLCRGIRRQAGEPVGSLRLLRLFCKITLRGTAMRHASAETRSVGAGEEHSSACPEQSSVRLLRKAVSDSNHYSGVTTKNYEAC